MSSSLSASKRFWCAEASDVHSRENLYVIVVLSGGKFARLSPGPRSFNVYGHGYLYARSVLEKTGLDLPYRANFGHPSWIQRLHQCRDEEYLC